MPSILIEVSHQAYVYNNIIDTFQYGGIKLSSATDGYYVNNVLMNGEAGGYYVLDGGASYVSWAWVRNNVIANNILYNNKLINEIRMQPDDGGIKYYNNICRNNLIYKSTGSIRFLYGSAKKRGLDAWQKDTPFGEGSISEEPSFVANTYKLTENSPCINAGFNFIEETMLTDYYGNNRFIGTIVDMGVFEHSIGVQKDASLKSLNVSAGDIHPEFNHSVFTYYDTLSNGTTVTPIVTALASNNNAVIEITNATNITSANEEERTTSIKVTASDGVSTNTYNVIFFVEGAVSSSQQLVNESVLAYPNPGNGNFTVKAINNNIDNIEVFDLTGKMIYSTKNTTVNISDKPKGVYILKVKTSKSISTIRLIKDTQ
jgi:hypothetical protein